MQVKSPGCRLLHCGQVDANVNLHFNVGSEKALSIPVIPTISMTDTRYPITELSREFEITPRAIRFYENQGLLTPARVGTNGLRRVYSARDRTRLKLTLRGKRLGFTLSEIRDLLDLYDSPTDTAPQLQAFLATVVRHREVLEQQREDLNATLDELAQYEA